MTRSTARADWRGILPLTTGHATADLCQGALPALLPFFVSQRHLSYAAAAALVFVATIGSSVVQPVVGYLGDRIAMPWVMAVGLLLAGTGLALSGVTTSYPLILAVLGVSGIGVALFHPEAARLVHRLAAGQQATGMSLFSVGGNLGFAVAPLLTTFLLLRLGLAGSALLLIPPGLAAAALLVHRHGRAETAGHPVAGRVVGRPADRWDMFARLSGAVLCRSIVFFGLNTFLPLYWIARLHGGKAAGGAVLTVLLLFGVGGTVLGGRLADRYGARRLVVAAFGLQFPLLLLFAFTGNPLLATVVLAPLGVVLFAPSSVMVVMGQNLLPHHVSTAAGVTIGLSVTIGGIAAPILGAIVDRAGFEPMLLALAFVPLVALAFSVTLPGKEPVPTRSDAALARAPTRTGT